MKLTQGVLRAALIAGKIPVVDKALAALRDGLDQEGFVAAAEAELAQEDLKTFEHAVPPWQCYLGLRRYWDKQLESPPGS